MKKRITVECSCGKRWREEDTPETAKSVWNILLMLRPEIGERVPESKRSLEAGLRLLWAMHSLTQQERGDKRKHEAEVDERITLEDSDIAPLLKERSDLQGGKG